MIGPEAIERDVRIVASGEEWFGTLIQVLADRVRVGVWGGHGRTITVPVEAITEAEIVDGMARDRVLAIAERQRVRLSSKRPVFGVVLARPGDAR